MVEAYLSSNLQANPTRKNRYINNSLRISKWNWTRTSWLFHEYPAHIPQSLSTEKDTDAMDLLLQDAAIIVLTVRHWMEMNWVVRGSNLWWIITCRSAQLCCRYSITRNSRVFPPLHPLLVRHTGQHITACTVCGRQFMITTHCRSVKFMVSFLALRTGDHSPNFELWYLVLSVELVWYIQSSQLQPVLSVNDSNISILLHNQQYQLHSEHHPSMQIGF